MGARVSEQSETKPAFLLGVKPYKEEPYPFTELQEKCIRDLETTDAPQAHGFLEAMAPPIGFCCLGRFCVVAGAARRLPVGAIAATFSFGEDSSATLLPASLATLLRMHGGGEFRQHAELQGKGTFASLVNMNDSGLFTFKDIAAYIRHDPWNVFFPEGSDTHA